MKILSIITESTPAYVTAGPGETVYSIARKYNVDPLALYKLNNFNKDTRLEIGQKVILQSKTPTADQSKTKSKPVDKQPAVTPNIAGKTLPPGQTLEDNPLGAYAEKVARNLGMPEPQVPYYMANVKKETAHFQSLEEWDDGNHFAKYEPGTPGGKHLGNIYPGDGKLFRGRGFIHITGRYNYEHFGSISGHPDIVKNPDLMLKPDVAAVVCYHYWNDRVWPKLAASVSKGVKGASDAVTAAVQGGNHQSGKDERTMYVKEYLKKQWEMLKHVNPFRKADADIEEPEQVAERFCPDCGGSLEEEGRASRALCTSGRPDSALGASQLASCKSQGLRARDGEKSHLITHGARKVRITVGGKKIKGKKYGGPLPDYGTRKNQLEESNAPQVYAVGDSHAEGICYAKGIINRAHGGQPSTSTSNLSGTWQGHPTGIENIPDNSFVILAQGCNDAATSLRMNMESNAKTPLVPPQKIAGHVVNLISEIQAKNCKVIFLLFPNGDPDIKKWYGGPYQEKVRNALRDAVGVPIIDLEGSKLADGVHATPSAYKSAGEKALSMFGATSNDSAPSKTTSKTDSASKLPPNPSTQMPSAPSIFKESLEIPVSSYDAEPIKAIQTILINLLYDDVKLTGILDTPTKNALKELQKQAYLTPNGLPNKETIELLNDYIKKYPKLAPSNIVSTPTKPTKTTPEPTKTTPEPTKTTPEPTKTTPEPAPTTTTTTDSKVPPWIPKNSRDPSPWIMNTPSGLTDIATYLLDKLPKMTIPQLKGIMANMAAESSCDPGQYVEHDTHEAKYITNPRGEKILNPVYKSAGPSGGLCQWHNERFWNMVEFCGGMANWQKNWQKQLDFLSQEPETRAYLKRNSATAEEAVEDWMKIYEKPHDISHTAVLGRTAYIDQLFYKPRKKE